MLKEVGRRVVETARGDVASREERKESRTAFSTLKRLLEGAEFQQIHLPFMLNIKKSLLLLHHTFEAPVSPPRTPVLKLRNLKVSLERLLVNHSLNYHIKTFSISPT